jgi:hypothetical protein
MESIGPKTDLACHVRWGHKRKSRQDPRAFIPMNLTAGI